MFSTLDPGARMQSYQGGVSYEEPGDFQTLSGNIASNIKKISQNGKQTHPISS